MFHVKHRSAGAWRLAAALFVLAAVASGCGRLAKPEGWAAPVPAADGVVLVQDRHGAISALRIDTQPAARLWTFPEDKDDQDDATAFYATPIVDRSGGRARAFLVAYSGDVYALDLQSGRRADGWPASVNVGAHVFATPAFDGARLLVATNRGQVVPVDVASGRVDPPLVTGDGRIWSAPVLAGSSLIVANVDHTLRAVNPRTGDPEWTRDLGGAVAGDAALDGDTLFVGTLESRLLAIDLAASGATRWSISGDHWFWARPLVEGDTVYAATVGGYVHAVTRDGRELWRSADLRGELRSAPAIAGGALVVATRDGEVIGLDPGNGKELWRQRVDGARFLADPLVVGADVLYTTSDGELWRARPGQGGAVEQLYKRS
jgi:outer membrane protein assembly factor BamB